jgi:hypothetical protein
LPVDLLTFPGPLLLDPVMCHILRRRLRSTMHYLNAQTERLFCLLFAPALVPGVNPQVRKARKTIAYTVQQ